MTKKKINHDGPSPKFGEKMVIKSVLLPPSLIVRAEAALTEKEKLSDLIRDGLELAIRKRKRARQQ